jgi:hypothetical protein
MPLQSTSGAATYDAFGVSAVSAVTQAEAIDFDGTNDYLSRLSDLVGNTNSQTFTFSCFVYPIGSSTNWLYLATDSITNSRTFIRLNPSSGSFTVSVRGIDASFNTCFEILNVSLIAANTWSSLIVSVNNAINTMWVSVNDVASSFSDPFSNTNAIDFTWNQHYVGIQSNNEYLGRMSNVFLDYTYRDLSVEANRRLFVTADLKPTLGQAALNPILYLPMSDPTAPGVNTGTGGNFDLTGVVARSGRGPNQYNVPYSDLDGSADFLNRTTALSGLTDGGAFTISCCFIADTTTDNQHILSFRADNSRRFYFMYDGGLLTVVGFNSAGSVVLVGVATASIVINRNVSVQLSVDLSSTSNRSLYVNGQAASVTWSTYTVGGSIDFVGSANNGVAVGYDAAAAGGNYFNGKIGAVWFNTSYIDLSVPANLAKFVTGTGINATPVDLGATGQLPTGTSPLIYLPLYGNNAGRNYGTGGNFTVNSGPYTGARGPNEFWGNWAVMSNAPTGNNALFRNTGVVGVANSKTFTLSFAVNLTSRPNNSGFLYFIGTAGNIAFFVSFDTAATGALYLTGRNSSGTVILDATVSNVFSDGVQYYVQISVDLNNSANRSIYVNGVARTVTWTTYTNDFIQLAFGGQVWIGRGPANAINGRLSEFYFSTGYVDFTQEANRLKFIDAFGNPVNLTQQIEALAIPNPAIYMRFPPTAFGTNSGTGGNFTVNGTITDGGQL